MSRLGRRFLEEFDDAPTLFVRAPGRVNLIGDHTDYNGLPVFPMAIQREVRMALRPRDDDLVRIVNSDPEFGSIEFEVSPALQRTDDGSWANYCKAPAWEMARRYAIWQGFDAVLESDLPVASGLSSSSALVNAVGLALAEINEVRLDILVFAELMAEAERFTGTRGGGMDQAISLAARQGHAARITFDPLRLRHVALPPEWRIVVAFSGVRAEKSGAAQTAYNLRRAECEEALEQVGLKMVEMGMTGTPPSSYKAMRRAHGRDSIEVAAGAALSGKLERRFRHVVTEAQRVDDAVDQISAADLVGFGSLMDASHGSLHSDYNVSCRELDELVALAREGAAAGARLTGAGFGGCIVALADVRTVEGVLGKLRDAYFLPRGRGDRLEEDLFVAEPSRGASVTRLG